jgi:hypothetical protein
MRSSAANCAPVVPPCSAFSLFSRSTISASYSSALLGRCLHERTGSLVAATGRTEPVSDAAEGGSARAGVDVTATIVTAMSPTVSWTMRIVQLLRPQKHLPCHSPLASTFAASRCDRASLCTQVHIHARFRLRPDGRALAHGAECRVRIASASPTEPSAGSHRLSLAHGAECRVASPQPRPRSRVPSSAASHPRPRSRVPVRSASPPEPSCGIRNVRPLASGAEVHGLHRLTLAS